MNLKQRAALETAKIVGLMLVISITVNLLLQTDLARYVVIAIVATVVGYFVWLIFEIQFYRLKWADKSKELRNE